MRQSFDDVIEPLTERELQILRLKVERHSNQEIADELVLALSTVKWYVGQFYNKLHVNNRRELQDRVQALGLLDPEASSSAVTQHILPSPITSFIGREQEIADVTSLLGTTRLLTLTGAGGTGKTRLALEIAKKVRDKYRDGIHFINLAPLSNPDMVAKAIADVLGILESGNEPIVETLKRVLQEKQMLLLLDNFEHVLPAASLVSEQLQASAALGVLVTSREALQLYGEHEYLVPPLALPDSKLKQIVDVLAHNDAVQLFVQRSQAVSRTFQLTENNAATIAEICSRLDGLPLAIELAAARSKLLPPDALLKRLDSRLEVLTGGVRNVPARQQTIRNTIEWSYDLLDTGEKSLFARLAVFRGGRSLEAIDAVCEDGLPIDVFEGLASLVNKNLLTQYEDDGGEPRFWMLETIQEYALERLAESGEGEMICRRHAAYFTELAEQAESELRKAEQKQWFQRLEIEHDNLRTALEWSLSGGSPELGVRLVGALNDFWNMRIYQTESIRWVGHALKYVDEVAPTYCGRLFITAAHSRWRLRENLRAREFAEQAFSIAKELEDKLLQATALKYMGSVIVGRSEELASELPVAEALVHCQKALKLYRELGNLPQVAHALNMLGMLQMMDNNLLGARASHEECVTLARQIGDHRRVQVNIYNLCGIAWRLGEHQQATELAIEALHLANEIDDKFMLATTLAKIADPTDKASRAARLLAASEANLHAMGTLRQPGAVSTFNDLVATAREHLGDDAFAAAWAEGSAMSLDEAVAYALGENS